MSPNRDDALSVFMYGPKGPPRVPVVSERA